MRREILPSILKLSDTDEKYGSISRQIAFARGLLREGTLPSYIDIPGSQEARYRDQGNVVEDKIIPGGRPSCWRGHGSANAVEGGRHAEGYVGTLPADPFFPELRSLRSEVSGEGGSSG